MNVIRCCALASALAGGALPAVAQTAQIAPAPMVVGLAPAGNPNMLRSGTPISLKMAETVTTKDNRLSTGYLAHLEVLEAVTVNGMTVIPAGSPAVSLASSATGSRPLQPTIPAIRTQARIGPATRNMQPQHSAPQSCFRASC